MSGLDLDQLTARFRRAWTDTPQPPKPAAGQSVAAPVGEPASNTAAEVPNPDHGQPLPAPEPPPKPGRRPKRRRWAIPTDPGRTPAGSDQRAAARVARLPVLPEASSTGPAR